MSRDIPAPLKGNYGKAERENKLEGISNCLLVVALLLG